MTCKFCNQPIVLLAGNGNYWMHLHKDGRGHFITVHGADSANGIRKKIRYCPMCGERLGGAE